jgi:hypothetical protein
MAAPGELTNRAKLKMQRWWNAFDPLLIARWLSAFGVLVALVTAAYQTWHGWTPRGYWTVAVAASTFYGFGSLFVWRIEMAAPATGRPVWPWHVHQWWLNFLGSLAGWYCAYLVHRRGLRELGVTELVLVLFAFFGMTGWLPGVATGFGMAFGALAQKAMAAITPGGKSGD